MKNPFSIVTGKRTFDKVSSIEDAYKDKKITIEDTEPEVPLMQEPIHVFIPAATVTAAASTAAKED